LIQKNNRKKYRNGKDAEIAAVEDSLAMTTNCENRENSI